MSSKTDYIASIYWIAKDFSIQTGLSMQAMLAQAAQETGWGENVIAGSNNIFNVKADSSWVGSIVWKTAPEFIKGAYVNVNAKYRAYDTIVDAFVDRINFLKSNPRYQSMFKDGIRGDFEKEAMVLQKAGFATDPEYAANLVKVYSGPTMRAAIKQALNNPPPDATVTDIKNNDGTVTQSIKTFYSNKILKSESQITESLDGKSIITVDFNYKGIVTQKNILAYTDRSQNTISTETITTYSADSVTEAGVRSNISTFRNRSRGLPFQHFAICRNIPPAESGSSGT